MAVRVVGPRSGGVVVRRRVAALLGKRVAHVTGNRAARAVVAALLDPLLKGLDRCRERVVLNSGGLRHRVRLDSPHARPRAEHPLDYCFSDAK